jgi:hypothetical protein
MQYIFRYSNISKTIFVTTDGASGMTEKEAEFVTSQQMSVIPLYLFVAH